MCEVELGEPDWRRWEDLGEGGWAYDRLLMKEGRVEELDTCEREVRGV